ncbi:MAG: helix-turn-helix transcriptional regulator [Alphaproteobacteria bacterium]
MDRRDFLEQFRDRLEQVIAESALSRSAFAASAGMDRSTLSQLLSPRNDRLPRVETLAAVAARWQVSIDWLLGLSQQGHLGADIMPEQISIRHDTLSAADEMLIEWHTEAIGYKIRYAPATLPDLLKNEDVIRYELAHFSTTRPEQLIETAAARLDYQRRPETDMEACNSVQAVSGFCRGEGIWSDLDRGVRIHQIDHMIELVEELYPTFRWFLYDGLQRFSIPVTIFGPLRAVIYVGQMYFVFNSTEHIRTLTQHFDGLIRGAVLQPTDVPDHLHALRQEIG